MGPSKRLVICCDGTWQDLEARYPTNVAKTAQATVAVAEDGWRQIVYYDPGLGTRQIKARGSIIDFLTRLGGGGLGLGIDNKIQQAYLFLCLNHQPGDEIYLFGFSRGAYTVRSLAGLVYNSGLVQRKYIRAVPAAYELYRSRAASKAPRGLDAVNFRSRFGDRVPIKALCCWDTVASIGLPEILPFTKGKTWFNRRYSFHDCRISAIIEHAYHAVAIDENRRVFDYTPMESDRDHQLRQVWFPGGHGSVGGGTEEESGLSDRALAWMLSHVADLGLSTDPANVEHRKTESRTDYGIKPDYRVAFQRPRSIVGRRARDLPPQTTLADIDVSTKQRWADAHLHYRPENLDRFALELDAWH